MAAPERSGGWARQAGQGLWIWSAYGAIELAFVSIVPWVALPSHLYARLYGPLTLLCAAAYAASGIAIGTLSWLGVAALRKAGARCALLAALLASAPLWTVPVAFVANVWAIKGPHRALVMAAIATVPFALSGIARHLVDRRGGARVGGWLMALVLAGGYWIAYESPGASPRWVNECIALGYAAAIAATAIGARAASECAGWRVATMDGRAAWVHVGAWAIIGAGSVSIDQQPLTNDSAASAPARAGSPNIVLVTLDTVRADHLPIYGYSRQTTPHLAALAREATLYTNAVAAGNMTLTSHASLFSGQYPDRHGAHPPATPISPDVPVLAEILAAAGYRTAAVVANSGYVTAEMGLARGFQYFDERGPVRLVRANARGELVTRGNAYLRGLVGRSAAPLIVGDATRPYYRDAGEISAEVSEQLESLAGAGEPFFLFANYMDAHMPYLPPPPFDRSFPGRDPTYSWSEYPSLQRDLARGFRTIEPREREHLISQYDGAIAYQDQQLARVFTRLEELGLYDRTLIIVTSDHGEAFGSRGFLTHGATLFQEQIHVPLLIKYPGSRQARVSDELVAEVDVMPTILDLLGLEIPDAVQGTSLLQAGARPIAASESFPSEAVPLSAYERAVVTPDRLKLIEGERTVQLFDLARDPRETANLGSRDLAHVAALTRLLDQRLPWQRHETSLSEDEIDRQTAKQLNALGYLQ